MFSSSVASIDFDSRHFDRLTTQQFNELSELVRSEAGICIASSKRGMLEARLRKRLKKLGLATLGDYYAHFFKPENYQVELPHLLDVVTTNKTDFFRENEHYSVLEKTIVPELLRLRRLEQEPLIKVWSAASSTGAEAYSTAMLLMSLREQGRSFQFSVLGTDLSTEVLRTAADAIYPVEMMEPVPRDLRQKYVLVSRKAGSNLVRIAPEVRRYVSFRRLNLMDDRYPFDRDIDVIFLRNVLIYFDAPTQIKVTKQLSQHLRRGGYLILGHSEAQVGRSLDLKLVASGVYQKL